MSEKSFDLQLVVIAVLIPVYLQIIPVIFAATASVPTFGSALNFLLLRGGSYVLGGLWFLCLIFGSVGLLPDKSNLAVLCEDQYKKLFKFNSILTLAFFVFIIFIYFFYFVGLAISQGLVLLLSVTLGLGIIILSFIALFLVKLWRMNKNE